MQDCVWIELVNGLSDKEFLKLILMQETKKGFFILARGKWGKYFMEEIQSSPKRSLNTHLERMVCEKLRPAIIQSKSPETIFILRMARVKI